MYPSAVEFVRHIVAECEYILLESSQHDFDDFIADPRLSRAICRSQEIVGEAANKIDPDLKAKYPFIPWREMGDLRNRIIHHYFGVDYEIVWDTVTREIPNLKGDMDTILAAET